MRLILPVAVAAVLHSWIAPVAAQDRQPCGKDMVCASDPDSVVQALARASFRPRLGTDSAGDPMIEVDGKPYHFDVYFYGCIEHRNCDSLRFEVLFSKDPNATVGLANKWNAGHRFLSAAVKENGNFVLSYDLGMIGGATRRNFADTLDWWNSMLGESADFFAKELKG